MISFILHQINFCDRTKNIEPNNEIIIHDFVLNIATYKDMCPKCVSNFETEMKDGKLFITDLKKQLANHYKVNPASKLIVLASGMSEYGEKSNSTRSAKPNFSQSSRSDMLSLPKNESLVYHVENPYGVATFPRLINLWSY